MLKKNLSRDPKYEKKGGAKLRGNRSTQIFFRVYIFHANMEVGLYFSTQIEKWSYIFPRKYKYWSIFFHANVKLGLYS